jgi:hypothetical protein
MWVEFPRMMYKLGGAVEIDGVMVDYKVVDSQIDFDNCKDLGWCLDVESAKNFKKQEIYDLDSKAFEHSEVDSRTIQEVSDNIKQENALIQLSNDDIVYQAIIEDPEVILDEEAPKSRKKIKTEGA